MGNGGSLFFSVGIMGPHTFWQHCLVTLRFKSILNDLGMESCFKKDFGWVLLETMFEVAFWLMLTWHYVLTNMLMILAWCHVANIISAWNHVLKTIIIDPLHHLRRIYSEGVPLDILVNRHRQQERIAQCHAWSHRAGSVQQCQKVVMSRRQSCCALQCVFHARARRS